MPEVSIVVPVYNELENVDLMYQELVLAMKNQHRSFEFIIVDDGSNDRTPEALREIAKVDQRVKLVLLKRNYGQTAAMMAGIQSARGQSIVTIDGDLQNDPADIPMMLDKLDEGFDLVHGWRKNRQDKTLSRNCPRKSQTGSFPKLPSSPSMISAAHLRRCERTLESSWNCTAKCIASSRSLPINLVQDVLKS